MKLSPSGIRMAYPSYKPPRSILKKKSKYNETNGEVSPPRRRRLTLDPKEANRLCTLPCSPSPNKNSIRIGSTVDVCSYDKKAPPSAVKGAPNMKQNRVTMAPAPGPGQESWWPKVTVADYPSFYEAYQTDSKTVTLRDGTVVPFYGEFYFDEASPSNFANASGQFIVESGKHDTTFIDMMQKSIRPTLLKNCQLWFEKLVADDWEGFKSRHLDKLLKVFPQLQVAPDLSQYITNTSQATLFAESVASFTATAESMNNENNATHKAINEANNKALKDMNDANNKTMKEINDANNKTLINMTEQFVGVIDTLVAKIDRPSTPQHSRRSALENTRKVQSARKPRMKMSTGPPKRVLLNDGVFPVAKRTGKQCPKCRDAFRCRYDFCQFHRSQLDTLTKLV